MNPEQIETAYQETAKKINAILDEDNKKNEEIDREVQKLCDQRQLEKKIYYKQKDEKEKDRAGREGTGGSRGVVKDEDEADGLGLRM